MMQALSLRTARGGLRPLLVAAALLAGFGAAAQKIDDVPPAVQNNVAPNFMFMIDTSGSMNNIVPAAPYSASASYLNSCPASSRVAAGSTVEIRVVGGEPRFRVNGGSTNLVHTSVGSTPARCFDNASTYSARLLANAAVGGDRAPDGNYLDSEYSGHFLNWYFGNYGGPVTGWFDRKKVASGAVESRMEIARRVAKDAVDLLPVPSTAGSPAAVRVGLSHYATSPLGGRLSLSMRDLDASARTTMKSNIDALTPSGATPLAATLADIARYLSTGYTGMVATATEASVPIDDLFRMRGADASTGRRACLANSPVACDTASATAAQRPIQYWCQRSSVLALTDGRPQSDRVFEGTTTSNRNNHVFDYIGECAANPANCRTGGTVNPYGRKNDRQYESNGSDFMDDVTKLMFDVDFRPDLQPATGTKTTKNNISTYMIGFADPMVQNDPLLRSAAKWGKKDGTGKLITATDGPGLLQAFREAISDALARDAAAAAVAVTNAQITAGTVGYASSYNSGNWYGDLEAYSLDVTTGLQNGAIQWSARDKLEGQGAANRRIASYDGSAGVAFTTASGTALRATTPSLTDDLINYTRGDRSLEGTTFRPRPFLLGDINNAEPVVVNYSGGPVVYQAANDGMLHAFDGRIEASASTRGQELWAYVPQLVHAKLAGRAAPIFQHEYLVDGTPATAEIATTGSLRRLLVGGLAKGGAGYYALNITNGNAANENAAASKVLWEKRLTNMGYSFGTPLIVRTADGWKVVVASGLRNDGAPGSLGGDGVGHVWVLNPTTGAVEKEFTTSAGDSAAASGLAHLAKASNVSAASAVRHVWGADLLGNVWRFDLDAADGSSAVKIAALKDASGNPQPVSGPPVVSPVAGSSTKYFVYAGTGQYYSLDDVPGTSTPNSFANQTQTIYGIVDDTSVASPALPDIRGSNGSNCPSNGGNGDFLCQKATQNPDGSYTVSHNAMDISSRRGFYLDIPIGGGRVNTQPAVTAGGTLVVVVNQPSNVVCNPGGSSYLFQLSATTGGAIVKNYGGSEYYPSIFSIGDALSSRPVIVTTNSRPRGLLRLSDKTTQSREIFETAGSAPTFRRIYMRPLH